jgi:hypothetical protein
MILEIDTADTFIAGGNYDRVHLVNADGTFDDLDGKDSYWIVKVRKGTPTHEKMSQFFAESKAVEFEGDGTEGTDRTD